MEKGQMPRSEVDADWMAALEDEAMLGSPLSEHLLSDAGPIEPPGLIASHQVNSSLRPSAFIQAVVHAVQKEIGSHSNDFHCHARSRLAKFWFGRDDSIHYEIWLHERTSQLEIGLHLESSPAVNRAIFKRLDNCLLEIQSELGQSFWLEEWDRGWARLYETQPLWPLDESRVDEVASRLRQVIGVIQPIYEAISTQV
jgi:hypothetical protein